MVDRPVFVIVGASLTGAKAAEGLRETGFAGRIVLAGRSRSRPTSDRHCPRGTCSAPTRARRRTCTSRTGTASTM